MECTVTTVQPDTARCAGSQDVATTEIGALKHSSRFHISDFARAGRATNDRITAHAPLFTAVHPLSINPKTHTLPFIPPCSPRQPRFRHLQQSTTPHTTPTSPHPPPHPSPPSTPPSPLSPSTAITSIFLSSPFCLLSRYTPAFQLPVAFCFPLSPLFLSRLAPTPDCIICCTAARRVPPLQTFPFSPPYKPLQGVIVPPRRRLVSPVYTPRLSGAYHLVFANTLCRFAFRLRGQRAHPFRAFLSVPLAPRYEYCGPYSRRAREARHHMEPPRATQNRRQCRPVASQSRQVPYKTSRM